MVPRVEVDNDLMASLGNQVLWDEVYERLTPEGVSWYEPEALVSLELVAGLRLPAGTPILDVGGGASTFVDGALELGFTDISVLDISTAALGAARARVGRTGAVHWIQEDLLRWRPERRYGLWHDRAVFHFLTDPRERQAYLELLTGAVDRHGWVILGTFAADGPATCSGLPVARYGPGELAAVLPPGFVVTEARREEHSTPSGKVQPFTWVCGRAP